MIREDWEHRVEAIRQFVAMACRDVSHGGGTCTYSSSLFTHLVYEPDITEEVQKMRRFMKLPSLAEILGEQLAAADLELVVPGRNAVFEIRSVRSTAASAIAMNWTPAPLPPIFGSSVFASSTGAMFGGSAIKQPFVLTPSGEKKHFDPHEEAAGVFGFTK